MTTQDAKNIVGKAFKRKNGNYIQLNAVNEDGTVTVKIYNVYSAGRGQSQVMSVEKFFSQI